MFARIQAEHLRVAPTSSRIQFIAIVEQKRYDNLELITTSVIIIGEEPLQRCGDDSHEHSAPFRSIVQ
jgi:hypothetical protein